VTLVELRTAPGSPGPPEEIPAFHVVNGKQRLLFVVNGSRLYALDDAAGVPFDTAALEEKSPPIARTLTEPAALSLNIAQSCNLSCRYCYAGEGRFGGEAKLMPLETAQQAVRRHIRDAGPGPVSVGFIGGEPLLNRKALHATTHYAAQEAARRGIAITFGITTNATLLSEQDLDLLRSYPFAVNVSMDGTQERHDELRPARGGRGSFDRAVTCIAPLLARPGKARIAARITVTRRNLNISAQIEALGDIGFSEIGVSPMRTGPDEELQLAAGDWPSLLDEMRTAARHDWARACSTGAQLRFTNFSTALRQIYRGACNALPCGAAASYVSLSADGRYYTCHRTIGDESLALGDLDAGLSLERRRAFVEQRAVDRQMPCRSCWARYLCGGGCHAEVLRAGREGCDSIRGWLEFCISAYPEVLALRPDLLKAGEAL
jgi:uncharacterized protein